MSQFSYPRLPEGAAKILRRGRYDPSVAWAFLAFKLLIRPKVFKPIWAYRAQCSTSQHGGTGITKIEM